MRVLDVGMEALAQTDLDESDRGAEEDDRTGDEENVLQDACPYPRHYMHCEFNILGGTIINAKDRKIRQRTGEGQDERARATDQEHDADVEAQGDAAVEDERDDSDAREHLFERRPAFENRDEEGVEARADL